MKLLMNTTSPYTRIARIALWEKGFHDIETQIVDPWGDTLELGLFASDVSSDLARAGVAVGVIDAAVHTLIGRKIVDGPSLRFLNRRAPPAPNNGRGAEADRSQWRRARERYAKLCRHYSYRGAGLHPLPFPRCAMDTATRKTQPSS